MIRSRFQKLKVDHPPKAYTMSADKYSLYYCLTAHGWVPVDDEDARAHGWVCFYEIKIEQGSGWGRTDRHWCRPKPNPNCDAKSIRQLEEQFPKPVAQTTLSPDSLKALGS